MIIIHVSIYFYTNGPEGIVHIVKKMSATIKIKKTRFTTRDMKKQQRCNYNIQINHLFFETRRRYIPCKLLYTHVYEHSSNILIGHD